MNPWQGYEISLSNAHSLRYVSHLSLQQTFASTDTQGSENAKEPLANRRLQPQKPYNRKKHRDWKKKIFFFKKCIFSTKKQYFHQISKKNIFFFVFEFFVFQIPSRAKPRRKYNFQSWQLRATPFNSWEPLGRINFEDGMVINIGLKNCTKNKTGSLPVRKTRPVSSIWVAPKRQKTTTGQVPVKKNN